MIEKIIAFLQWIQGSESLKKWVDRFFSFLILFVSATLIWTIYKEAIGNCSRYYGCSDIFPWDTLPEMIVGGFLTLAIVISLVYGAYKKIWSYEYSVMRLLLNTTLPFLIGLILLSLYRDSIIHTYSYGPGWYIYFFGGLYALSPFVNFIRSNTSSEGILKKTLGLYSKYIVSFLIGLVIFTVLFWLSMIFDQMRYMDFSQIVLFLFIVFCVFALGTWLILTYAWDEVKPIDDISSRNIRKGAIWLAALFLFIWISPDWKQAFIDDRIAKAENILAEGGNTPNAYKDAASIWGLKWSMKERFLENRLYNKDLYARIFDTSIESDIEDEIDVNQYRAWNSNGTSMLARGENAKVELNFAKHESEIKSDISAVETTVTYEFQNTDTQNQEVIYSIELPSSDSVVTDLRLGLNLELTGTLAPRGAAEQVYNDSLRRNTDPALLEQTGPTTYRLRVFPVPSVSDPKTQGRQRVSFRYVTPIVSGDDITLMPKTDILNLKLTKKSEIVIRVMEGTKVLHQDSFKTKDIEELVAGKQVSVKLENTLKDSLSYCAINTYEGLDISKLKTSEKNLTKNIVFLDISQSAGKENTTKKRYQELINTWKNNGAALDIYTFNTLVTSAGYDLSDIDFWGNTDMAAVISYIKNNGIENANIVILTDDASYESANVEDKTIDYKKLKSNRISLIQIGDKIRTLKTEVTKSILATEGDVLRLAPGASLDEGIRSIFAPKKVLATCEPYNGNNSGALSALEGGRDGKKVVGEILTATGKIIKYTLYPAYLNKGLYYGTSMSPECALNKRIDCTYGMYVPQDIPTPDGMKVPMYYSDIYYSGSSYISETGYYVLSGTNLEQVKERLPIYSYEERYLNLGFDGLLEIIGKTSHIINQSMSLIALENDQQRRDLERYSNQDGKYDTTYQNFNNTNQVGSPQWNRREIMIDDMAMPMSESVSYSRGSSRTSSDTLFGMNSKATANSIGSSSDSYSLGGGGVGLLSGGSSSGRGGLLQIIAIIILFPLMAWYVLRKKKPQAAPETKKEGKKAE